jgi:tripartite-type tricarboxylate transporter receptor subunit TctC
MKTRYFCVAVLAALLVATGAHGQAYPNRYITFIVPFAPGGPPDIYARLIAPAMSEALGQPVVVENRVGAAGTIGAASVARAASDGYTIMIADIALVVGPSQFANLSYSPLRDFAPVALINRSNILLVVNPSFAAKSIADLVAMAKRKPGELQFVNSGIGTPPYLAALAFSRATGTTLAPISYRGAGPGMADVIAGHVPIIFIGLSVSAPNVQTGKVRALAVTGLQRLSEFADVPTFKESGVELGAIEGGTWFGIAAPATTPAPIIDKLNAAVNQALKDPKTRAAIDKAHGVVAGGTPGEFGALLQAQLAFWREALEAAGVRPN